MTVWDAFQEKLCAIAPTKAFGDPIRPPWLTTL